MNFAGTQVLVMGFMPTGQSPILVEFVVDGGVPTQNRMVGFSNTETIGNQVLFKSDPMPAQSHTASILVKQAGNGRNFTLDYLLVVGSDLHHTNLGAILGVCFGVTAFTLLFGSAYLWWRRRLRSRNVEDGDVGITEVPEGLPPYPIQLIANHIGEGSFLICKSYVLFMIYLAT